jgi:cell division septum initiation protein DivIVA
MFDIQALCDEVKFLKKENDKLIKELAHFKKSKKAA